MLSDCDQDLYDEPFPNIVNYTFNPTVAPLQQLQSAPKNRERIMNTINLWALLLLTHSETYSLTLRTRRSAQIDKYHNHAHAASDAIYIYIHACWFHRSAYITYFMHDVSASHTVVHQSSKLHSNTHTHTLSGMLSSLVQRRLIIKMRKIRELLNLRAGERAGKLLSSRKSIQISHHAHAQN